MFKKRKFSIVLIILISIIPLLDLFHAGLPITHDGQDHVARIANFYQNLKEGVLIPRWAGNLNWGYGHPILMFLYPLPSYTASFFHVIGFSLVDSIKLVFGISFILSGISMYLWAKDQFGEAEGLLASLLYMFAPYRFIDLYVRGAIGEHFAFVFSPLVLYFLLRLSKNNSYFNFLGGSLSLAGLILSHNAISLMFLPIIIFYSFYLYISSKNKKLVIEIPSVFILGFSFSAFFWFPGFLEGKYTLRNIVTKGGYIYHFIDLKSLLYGKWSFGGSGSFSIQLGLANMVLSAISLVSIFHFLKKRKPLFLFLIFLIVYSLFSVFIMVYESNFLWKKFLILQNFQFPWRFLSILVFTTSVLGAVSIVFLNRKLKYFILFFLIFLILFLNRNYWHAKGYLVREETFFTKVYNGTTDTGESAPVWSVRFMEKAPNKSLEVIEGKAYPKELKRTSVEHLYEIKADSKARIRENTLYFPGWKVYVDGKEAPIEFQDPKNRGLITFFIEPGIHNVKLKFGETKVRGLANTISLFSLIFIAILFLVNKKINVFKAKN